MDDKLTPNIHNPNKWDSLTIDELARYFLQHPDDPYYAVFLNANNGCGEHNEPLRSKLRDIKRKPSYFYLEDLDLDDLAQYVFTYFWENGFKGWNCDDYPFISYLYNILKPNSSLGYSIRKTESNPDAVSLDNSILEDEGITGMEILEDKKEIDENIIIESSIDGLSKESGIDFTDLRILFALDDPKNGMGRISNSFMAWANASVLLPAGKEPYTDLNAFKNHLYNLRRTLKRKKPKLQRNLIE